MVEVKDAHLVTDIALLGGHGSHVLLVRRAWWPYEGFQALPGGYVETGKRSRGRRHASSLRKPRCTTPT